MPSWNGMACAAALAALLALPGCFSHRALGGNGLSSGSLSGSGDDPGPGGLGNLTAQGSTSTGPGGNGTGDLGNMTGNATSSGGNGTASNLTAPPVVLMQMPSIRVGSHWVYETHGPNYEAHYDIKVDSATEVQGEAAYRMHTAMTSNPSVELSMSSDTFTWERIEDQASYGSKTNTTIQSVYGDYSSTSEVDYSPPCLSMQWPLVANGSGSWTCYGTTSKDGGSPQQGTTAVAFKVIGVEDVDVAAGHFRAVHLRVSNGNGARDDYYASAACGLVKSEVKSDSSDLVRELQSYSC